MLLNSDYQKKTLWWNNIYYIYFVDHTILGAGSPTAMQDNMAVPCQDTSNTCEKPEIRAGAEKTRHNFIKNIENAFSFLFLTNQNIRIVCSTLENQTRDFVVYWNIKTHFESNVKQWKINNNILNNTSFISSGSTRSATNLSTMCNIQKVTYELIQLEK